MRFPSLPKELWTCVLFLLVLSPGAIEAADAPPFPRDPAVWINSAPITLEQLRGKAVFLWFFEEGCPRCREQWPVLQAKAAEFQDQPIVFMAVNSGNPPADVLDYARSVNCSWPILADVDRSFEKAFDLSTISLQNISQFQYISHDGTIHNGNWQDFEGTIDKALQGAAWKIDPTGQPAELKDARLAVEYGNYKAAATALKKYKSSPKTELKEGVKTIQDFVQNEITNQVTTAQQAREAGQMWKAYELYQQISDRYTGFELPEDLNDIKKDLAKDPQVKSGTIQRKVLTSALKATSSGRPLTKKARTQLEKILADYPDTEMSRAAGQILEQAGQPQ